MPIQLELSALLDRPHLPATLAAKKRPVSAGTHLWLDTELDDVVSPAEEGFQGLPGTVQDRLLAQNILLALLGFRSDLIGSQVGPAREPSRAGIEDPLKFPRIDFRISELVSDTHADWAEPLMRLAADRAYVYRFGMELASCFRYGLLNVALGVGLVGICREFADEVVNVWQCVAEAPSACTSLVRIRLLPLRRAFEFLAELVDRHEGKQGVSVIRLLEERRQRLIGNDLALRSVTALLKQVCRPFFEMLSGWIYDGSLPEEEDALQIRNRHQDFMSWDLSQSTLPVFLSDLAPKVLQCGKLVLMLQKCGVEYGPTRVPLEYDPAPEHYVPIIELAYKESNAAVLQLLRNKCGLLERLRMFKDFLLVGHSVWYRSFLDACQAVPACGLMLSDKMARWEELRRFGRATFVSECAKQGFPAEWADDLSIGRSSVPLIKVVKHWAAIERHQAVDRKPSKGGNDVLTALKVDCKCEGPLRQVLDWDENETKYQFLSRVILRIKGLLYMLHNNCVHLSRPKTKQEKRAQRGFYALRTRMIGFLKSLEMYIMVEVIDPHFGLLMEKVRQATTVEEVRAAHNRFLTDCLAASMTTSEGLYKKLEMTFLSCRLFANAAKKMIESVEAGPVCYKDPVQQLEGVFGQFDVQFSDRLKDLLQDMRRSQSMKPESLEEHRYLRNMISRIDFNRYYESKGFYRE